MTPREFCGPDAAPEWKAAAHGFAGLLCASFAAYNLAAYLSREKREPHLLVNWVVYTGAVLWEIRKTLSHVR